jgi:ABC-2 type transport system permease protein
MNAKKDNLKNFSGADYFVVWSEIVKNIKILMAYPVIIVFWAIFPVFWFLPFIFQGEAFVGGLQSPSFAEVAGTPNYVLFIVVGAILNSYVLSALRGLGESMRREAYQGTLDYLLASPCNKTFILIGKAVSESINSTLFAIGQMMICVLFFGLEITLGAIMPIIFIIILLIAGLYGIALMLAAFSLQYKESHDIAHVLDQLFYLFTPVRYPVQSLPSWGRLISKLLPLTYALIAIRSIVIMRQNIFSIYQEIFYLFVMDVALISLGFYFFNWMEKRTKKSGAIGKF